MTKPDVQSIQWWQVNNVIPIIAAFVGMALTYGLLITRVSILETKMDLVLAGQEKITSTITKIEERSTALDRRITALEVVNNLRK